MNIECINKNLAALRIANGLTQAELAEAVGVTTDHIGHVENGSSGISLRFLIKICRILKITPNDVLSGEYETEAEDDGHTLSLDRMKPSDRDLMQKIAYFMENKGNCLT